MFRKIFDSNKIFKLLKLYQSSIHDLFKKKFSYLQYSHITYKKSNDMEYLKIKCYLFLDDNNFCINFRVIIFD